jgi:intracellular sulfur oxidation DsrE/DsrF family protein
MQTPGAWPLACLLAVLSITSAFAAETAPWGKGKPQTVDYSPQRVVYDVAVSDRAALSRVLDRASYLNNLYQADPFAASIVLVLHGDEIPLFAIGNYGKYKELMTRAQSLTVGGIIEIRMCQIAARGHGFDPEDIHGFVQIVPMADAEIVRLQQEDGYAYMQ